MAENIEGCLKIARQKKANVTAVTFYNRQLNGYPMWIDEAYMVKVAKETAAKEGSDPNREED